MTECTLQIKKFPAELHHWLRVEAVGGQITLRDMLVKVVADARKLKESTQPKGKTK